MQNCFSARYEAESSTRVILLKRESGRSFTGFFWPVCVRKLGRGPVVGKRRSEVEDEDMIGYIAWAFRESCDVTVIYLISL